MVIVCIVLVAAAVGFAVGGCIALIGRVSWRQFALGGMAGAAGFGTTAAFGYAGLLA